MTTSTNPFGHAIADILRPFPGVSDAQFFVNAVDTTTNGVDIVADYSQRLPKGSLKATVAANFTNTTVDAVHVPQSMLDKFAGVSGGEDQVRQVFLGRYGQNRLTDLLPRQKGTVGLRWDYAGWSIGARANYFGPTEFHSDDRDPDAPIDPATGEHPFADESFGAKVTFDVDFGYRVGRLWWSVGATNVFNTFPDEVKRAFNRNSETFLYTPAGLSAGAPYGTDGAFYYVRAEYRY